MSILAYLQEEPESVVLSLPLLGQFLSLGLVGGKDGAGVAQPLASRTIKLPTHAPLSVQSISVAFEHSVSR